ncbi:DUF3905 domain-containing protein [Bacillus sp. ISL-40]|uniref:DUF3905 domain-containing protein n=1 Tax=unclassified Bacillus (in: firmicutes) TaxID=185979 RepID=UPI001BE84041|nr:MULTISPECIES: DUF3905 domain-containing protein [unclassified Bacillus (in: firmicutes)]MBT2697002.1 DUF3905 domain-containing protein [Bacillus sp. ISL-40]MBT2722430.1 DUF3905 domain-containing protein [Bacillus sp. ISL-46]MBT2741446.1 DUF3905 domain-containing protein [Bacillus sp. ISL-77]
MKNAKNTGSADQVSMNETMPHQINAPSFEGTGIKMEPPFVNRHGVTIGDSIYASSNSPLETWTKDTDPAIMAGDEWVHPTNDIGWNTAENRELLESKKKPQAYPFMHPTKDVSKGSD